MIHLGFIFLGIFFVAISLIVVKLRMDQDDYGITFWINFICLLIWVLFTIPLNVIAFAGLG